MTVKAFVYNSIKCLFLTVLPCALDWVRALLAVGRYESATLYCLYTHVRSDAENGRHGDTER